MPHIPADAPSDETLAANASLGCAESFEELVRRYQLPLLQFLRRFGARDHSEDLLQETFLRAYQNLHRYRPSERFAPWVFTIARRLGINHHHRSKPAAESALLGGVASREPCPAQQALEADDRLHLWNLAERVLGRDEFTAMWLFYVEEMPAPEIATVVERSWVAVKAILFRARRKLSKAMEIDPLAGERAARMRKQPRRKPNAPLEVEAPHV